VLSYRPSPWRSRSPSILSAGKRLGTTRRDQPFWSRKAYTSCGALSSAPGQNGQNSDGARGCGSRRCSRGRLARSVEMMTQRPTMGSFLSSGKGWHYSHNSCYLPPRAGAMPIYVYECQQCGKEFEYSQSINDAPKTVCEECGGKLVRIIAPTAFVLKG